MSFAQLWTQFNDATVGSPPTEEPLGLSPMQSEMLFQTLLEGSDAPGLDVQLEQLQMSLDETLETREFGRAFDHVLERYPSLSTAFRWQGLERPLQEVRRKLSVRVERLDWSELDEPGSLRALQQFIAQDRRRGFDLRVPPLMRVTIVDMGRGRTEVVWTYHPILVDRRSLPIVVREVFEAYAALRAHVRPRLPRPLRPYSEYLNWLAKLEGPKSLPFFAELLRGKSAPTPLPDARGAARPSPERGHATTSLFVNDLVADGARRLAQQANTTLAVVVHAAWALVLSRFTGDQDVLFGSARACRDSALGSGAGEMVGQLANVLPLRVSVDDALRVEELLMAVRAQSLALGQHEHTPLADIRLQSEMPRGTALFQTLLAFENEEIGDTLRRLGPAWERRRFSLHEQPATPLRVTVLDRPTLEVRLTFDRRHFRQEVIDRLGRGLCLALAELAQDPRRKLGEIELLNAEDRRRVLIAWNDTTRPFPERLCIHELFEQRVDVDPEATAVEMDGQTVSYGELEARSNRLAHALRLRGARPGRYVGVCLERGIDLVVALLSVAKSGAAYLPMDPRYPRERLELMAEEANALLVISETRYEALFSVPTWLMDGDFADELGSLSSARPERNSCASDACYAIFTSGSTGKPKGVVLSHRAVVNTLDWVTRTLEIGPGDRLLFVTSPCFDLSVFDIFGVLGAGGTVVIASQEKLGDPERLARAIVEERITIWNSTPASLQCLLGFLPASSADSPLRQVLLSGDWIPIGLPDAVRAAFPHANVTSLGGATEAAIWSNWYPVDTIDPSWSSIPYGRPIQNSRYHVLDRAMRPVPIGVAGDLYIGGDCLAEGYLNRPDLTRERFVPDPFSSVTGERLYKTGDLARYFEDGNLEFLGRTDLQVKIRGFRVELAEIDHALSAISEISAAICSAFVDASGQKSLVAYVVAKAGAVVDELSLKQQLASKLPAFMVPSRIVMLSALPLSRHGKVDRDALPTLIPAATRTACVEARTDLERDLVAIWQELLQVRPIGIEDNFFALGGHSLLAVLLVARLKNQLNLDVPLSRILEHPSIQALAGAIAQEVQASKRRSRYLVTLSAGGSGPPLVLLPGSGGYGFMYQRLLAFLPNHPIHVLRAIGAEDEGPVADYSIEEMAALYEPEILAACPAGPMLLGGYSLGILVAFELARRLRRRGREVPLLVSFDGFAPGQEHDLPLAERLLVHMKELAKGDVAARRSYLLDRVRNLRTRLERRLGRVPPGLDEAALATAGLHGRMRDIWFAMIRARDRYFPHEPEPLDLLLIRAEQPPKWPGTLLDYVHYGWDKFITGEISSVTVPGEHLQLFHARNVDPIARAISEHVAALQI